MSETTLSYLGLGINDPAVSWGSLINRDISTLSNLRNFPWLLYPVLMLLLVTLAFNFVGDALRDFYDPYSAVFKRRSVYSGSLGGGRGVGQRPTITTVCQYRSGAKRNYSHYKKIKGCRTMVWCDNPCLDPLSDQLFCAWI